MRLLPISKFLGDFKVLPQVSDHLLSYLATSLYSKTFDHGKCYARMKMRLPYSTAVNDKFGASATEANVFKAKFAVLEDNRAYTIATEKNPMSTTLAEFAIVRPCWSTLFPVKAYLMEHPKTAKKYRGMQPFGKYVAEYFNRAIPEGEKKVASSTPDFKDHIRLMEMTNTLSDHLGIPTPTINTMMYLEGMSLLDVELDTRSHKEDA